MKYVSIDIETTGLDREKCEILSIGAVIEDTANPRPIDELPKYHVAIKRNGFYGEPTALTMNAGLIGAITEYQNSRRDEDKERIAKEYDIRFLDESEVAVDFYHWLFAYSAFEYDPQRVLSGHVTRHPLFGMVPVVGSSVQKAHINVAGKNFATFDKVFLERLPRWKQCIEVRNRILDPAILFVDWKEDGALPGLNLCKNRANILGEVTHNALEDAIDVVEVLRTKYVTPKNK